MAENENVVVENNQVVSEQPQSTPPATEKKGFGAKVKEFFRKKVVGLKRKPQKIAFLFLAIVSIYNLLTLSTYSQAIITYGEKIQYAGLMVFINTLFSVLILVAFLNTFPKLKKKDSKAVFTMEESGIKLHVNIPMLAVTVFMAAAMIVCEIAYNGIIKDSEEYKSFSAGNDALRLFNSTFTLSTVHVILLGIFLVLLFTLPLYRKLIMKIDTSVKVESATENMGSIDIQD